MKTAPILKIKLYNELSKFKGDITRDSNLLITILKDFIKSKSNLVNSFIQDIYMKNFKIVFELKNGTSEVIDLDTSLSELEDFIEELHYISYKHFSPTNSTVISSSYKKTTGMKIELLGSYNVNFEQLYKVLDVPRDYLKFILFTLVRNQMNYKETVEHLANSSLDEIVALVENSNLYNLLKDRTFPYKASWSKCIDSFDISIDIPITLNNRKFKVSNLFNVNVYDEDITKVTANVKDIVLVDGITGYKVIIEKDSISSSCFTELENLITFDALQSTNLEDIQENVETLIKSIEDVIYNTFENSFDVVSRTLREYNNSNYMDDLQNILSFTMEVSNSQEVVILKKEKVLNSCFEEFKIKIRPQNVGVNYIIELNKDIQSFYNSNTTLMYTSLKELMPSVKFIINTDIELYKLSYLINTLGKVDTLSEHMLSETMFNNLKIINRSIYLSEYIWLNVIDGSRDKITLNIKESKWGRITLSEQFDIRDIPKVVTVLNEFN